MFRVAFYLNKQQQWGLVGKTSCSRSEAEFSILT